MRKLINLISIFLFIFCSNITVSANELNPKIEKIALKLGESAEGKGLKGSSLTVFPLQADEKLSKKRVNFAAGEILTHYLVKGGVFKIVERTQLEEVLKEQKLGLSGAVDSKTAADIGRILGAKLLVLGNVVKIGKSYQLTFKLVDAETSEMLASEIIEVPIQVFDKEAESYLVLVPEYQAIGVFLGMSYGFPSVDKNLGPQSYNNITLTPTNPDMNQLGGGFGIRYWFKPKYMLQLDYSSISSFTGGGAEDLYTTPATVLSKGRIKAGYTCSLLRLTLERIKKFSEKFNWHLGAGVAMYQIDPKGDFEDSESRYSAGGKNYNVYLNTVTTDFITPYLKTGIEWRPQSRFGWSAFANLNILKKDFEQQVYVVEEPSDNQNLLPPLWKARLPSIYFETTISLYF